MHGLVTTVTPMKRGLKAELNLCIDEKGTNIRWSYNRYPDEKGTESYANWSYNRYPDEKGTETLWTTMGVTTVTPMKRGLKARLVDNTESCDRKWLQPLPR